MRNIFSKSPIKHSRLALFFVFVMGIVFWGAFNWSMEMTNTEEFCISCHEMEQNVYQEYKSTIHYSNRTGVRATCPDCHVPKEWVYKVLRKVQATNELYHWLKGSINTREKFVNKREELSGHVWKSMQKTDSRECRNCHDSQHMELEKQSIKAQKIHGLAKGWGSTCIDCHQGISHTLPDSFDKEEVIDGWHKQIEKQQVACQECHVDMPTIDTSEAW